MSVPFRREFPALLILLFLALSVEAQCTQKIADLPAAPELLGFRMGMTKEEIKTYVPQTVFGRKDEFGVVKTTINPSFDPKIDQSKFPSVRSVSLDLLDDHLISLWIGYDETFKVQPIEDFAQLVSTSLKVPDSWSTERGRALQLKCVDFQLQVSTIAGGPSLRVINVGAEDVIAERRQAKEEQNSAAEVETTKEPEITADKTTKVYYQPNCDGAKAVSEANKVVFKNIEEAEKAGYKLAKSCH
ncbi:MAG TPA: Ada metal-binding domain-containing protein [Pyrinomonadaceae bacterium]